MLWQEMVLGENWLHASEAEFFWDHDFSTNCGIEICLFGFI